MRICLWHGWLLEGAGSNVYTARVAERFVASGHDVLLLCQEAHPERYPWIDAWGSVDGNGPSELSLRRAVGPGRCTLLRPRIGTLLPVFVLDEYEGFEVKRFIELTDTELDEYLRRNADALRAAVGWHGSEVVITGHAIPGGPVGRLGLGPGAYVTKIHGSDLEYAIRHQERYRRLAADGLQGARAVTGSSSDVLARCVELVPRIEHLVRVVAPGVDTDAFRPRPRREALLEVAERLEHDPDTARGRRSSLGGEVAAAIASRDPARLDGLAATYDQAVPDPGAAERLRRLASLDDPIVGSFGKLIPQKGVDLLLAAASRSLRRPTTLVVGFGSFREWLEALALALRDADHDALAWLVAAAGISSEVADAPRASFAETVFTGRLDHRYAPGALAAIDVLVVPSVLEEAFGMVAAEGAAAGALPLVTRHSGLAEIATALESAVGHPGLFSFEPGPGAVERIADGLDRLLTLPADERAHLRSAVRDVVAREWSWERTAEGLLDAARA